MSLQNFNLSSVHGPLVAIATVGTNRAIIVNVRRYRTTATQRYGEGGLRNKAALVRSAPPLAAYCDQVDTLRDCLVST